MDCWRQMMVRIAKFFQQGKLRSSPRSINFGCSRASRSSAAAARSAAAIAAVMTMALGALSIVFRSHHEIKKPANIFRLFSTRNNGIDHAMIHQIFRCLEIFRQFFTNRFFDHAATGKANDGARFGNLNIAKHGK